MATAVKHAQQSDVWWIFLLEGIAAIIFGVLLLTAPAATLLALAVFLGFYLLFIGVLELVRVFVDPPITATRCISAGSMPCSAASCT